MTITAQAAEPESIGAQLATPQDDDPALPPEAPGQLTHLVPADAVATSMLTAHAVDDCRHHLAHASQHLDAAGDASGDVRAHHLDRCARHLDGARTAALGLAGHLRAHYPGEGAALDSLVGTVGLAEAVSDQAREATTGHLTQTVCHHIGHAAEHAGAMAADTGPEEQAFDAEHARKHLDEGIEHVGKLRAHLVSNYPREAAHLAGLDDLAAGAEDDGGGEQDAQGDTISGQAPG